MPHTRFADHESSFPHRGGGAVAHSLKRRRDRRFTTQLGTIESSTARLCSPRSAWSRPGSCVTSPSTNPWSSASTTAPTTTTPPTVTVPAPDLGGATIPAPRALVVAARRQRLRLRPGARLPQQHPDQGRPGLLPHRGLRRPARARTCTRPAPTRCTSSPIDPATRSGTIVGIPRDTYVNIPGKGKAKINTAMGSGGPELLMRDGAQVHRPADRVLRADRFRGLLEHGRRPRRRRRLRAAQHGRQVLGRALRARATTTSTASRRSRFAATVTRCRTATSHVRRTRAA